MSVALSRPLYARLVNTALTFEPSTITLSNPNPLISVGDEIVIEGEGTHSSPLPTGTRVAAYSPSGPSGALTHRTARADGASGGSGWVLFPSGSQTIDLLDITNVSGRVYLNFRMSDPRSDP